MIIEDIYILKDSDPIEMQSYEEVTVNLELEKASPCYNTLLTGRVFDKACPLVNAAVKVFDENLNPLFHTTTDDKGVFRFERVLSPGKYKVVASANYYKTSATKVAIIKADEVTEISFPMKKSSTLTKGIVYGKVLEEGSNKPVSNANVYIKSVKNRNSIIYRTISNSNGQYLVYNILPRKYIIEVEKVGYISQKPTELTVEKYNCIMLNFNLINNLNDYKGTISGTIKYDKVPVPDAAVFLYLLDEQGNERIVQVKVTNKYGVYLFSDVGKGSYIVKGKLQNGEDFERKLIL